MKNKILKKPYRDDVEHFDQATLSVHFPHNHLLMDDYLYPRYTFQCPCHHCHRNPKMCDEQRIKNKAKKLDPDFDNILFY